MQVDLLRKKFLDFFKARQHKIVESDSLVPKDDPTVLFTPAGMNQFKKEFLGFDSGFSRAATSQRCLRTDDLDKVGKTPCHHTFFEMLGNFSFGDYFKKEAILWAWEFLTGELKIDKARLWVSVYHDDEEAYKIWKDAVKVPAEKIIKLGDKENFWPSEAKAKGPNGPCGPCSEIFYDLGKDAGCTKIDCGPACECGRYTEVWNLVFTQFNRKDAGTLEPLPKKNIDTGMGLERLAAVMQGKKNNFETDLFKPLIKEITDRAVRSPQMAVVYAVCDHIRAIVFAIFDGVLPSNDGRGYVVRKLIRKSSLHMQALGEKKPFLYKLVPLVAEIMRDPYPELKKQQEDIAQIVLAEEKNFLQVLQSSLALFEEKFSAEARSDPQQAGKTAFELYDTYGIPFEFTLEWLEKNGIKISQEAFERELEAQKTRSKSQSAMKGDVFARLGTDYGVKETKFSGYIKTETKAKILKVIKDGAEAKKLVAGDSGAIILDKTVFYAHAGGQAADTGLITKGKSVFEVSDAQKAGKAVAHIGKVKAGSFSKGAEVLASVDARRRLDIARNHTATHLLQAALRKVLGQHVRQQGSLVSEDRLRFDFTHFKDLTDEELNRIEEQVNQDIAANLKVEKKEMTLAQAKKSGALAFFQEKYSAKVRVVSVGEVSREFCGGTHLDSTATIGIFKILQEGSVASGIRRIEAVTGEAAYKKLKEEDLLLADICAQFNLNRKNVLQELEKKQARLKELERQLDQQRANLAKSSAEGIIQEAESIKDFKVIMRVMENLDMDLLRKNVDLIKAKAQSATVIALGSGSPGRALLVVGVTPDLCAKGIDARNLIREVSGIIGGSGGGRPDFAQAGGNKPENFNAAFTKLKEIL